ncbi:Cupin superfamily protein [Nocardioides exalbidus]|uniref:Cupin superfamily protein n=1 Tax=Nocardioides exalbidus TaxID=402596 RepID=A0A1H4WL78_9ACTN|nr:cupin domain-containing protein [Nocardioides exalbidus]SEC93498.1 Cupin superfamily protein [Nocardioides exalbidus]
MHHQPDDGRPGTAGPAVGARPALARLVGDVDDFAESTWARGPLLRPSADPAGFDDLLTAGAVDELLGERGLRTPFLRVAKAGSTLATGSFTAPGGVGAGIADQVSDDKLTALFADGSTIVLQALHRVWPPIIDFCQQLAADLGHPVQANAYVTPPQNHGFDDHYDVHDVFVLQVAGRKKWSIHAPVLPSPLRDQPWTDRRDDVRRAAGQEAVIETVLEPGDTLYLPRGYLHSATALGGYTIHLTLGVHSWTRHAVAEELTALALRRLAEDEQARGSLPLGTGLDADDIDADLVAKLLRDALDHLDPADVAARLRARRRGTQRAAPIGPLAQHDLATSLADETVVRLRAHVDATLAGAAITSRVAAVAVGDAPADGVRRLLAGEPVAASDLGLETTRRMIEAGLVVRG